MKPLIEMLCKFWEENFFAEEEYNNLNQNQQYGFKIILQKKLNIKI